MSHPVVSVVMAVKDGALYLRTALDSIAAQTFRDFEIIIVDGASTDETVQIAKSYRTVTCIPQLGTGFANAWSQGIEITRAPLITFLDSDDLWVAEKLALQVSYLRKHPEKDYVIGRVQFFSNPEGDLPPGFKPSLMNGSHIAYMPGTVMIRRAVFEQIGLFESGLQLVSDIAFFQRLRETETEVGIIDRILLHKRVHSGSLSNSMAWDIYSRELLSLLKGSLDRRRSNQLDIGRRR